MAFEQYIDDGLLSKQLIEIPCDLPLKYKPDQTAFQLYPSHELINFLKGLGFKALLKKVEDIKYVKDNENGPIPVEEKIEDDKNFHLVTNFELFLKTQKKHYLCHPG